MNEQIPCSIIKELLPLYTEELLQPESRALVSAHLHTCPNCKKVCQGMTADRLPTPAQRQQNLQAAKPLRRFRHRFWLNLLGAPLWLPLLLLLLALALTFAALVLTLWLLLWCIPLILGACSLAMLPLFCISLAQGHWQNALLSLGGLCLGSGTTLFFFLFCKACTLWLFAGCRRLFRTLFQRKNRKGDL